MIIGGVKFHPAINASGARGFDGTGYWFHSILKPFGLNYDESTFVAKTTTLKPRQGNMRSTTWFPDCIMVKLLKGITLNAVGLTGPGAEALFELAGWQERTKPFFLSFMSVASNQDGRLAELENFVQLLAKELSAFQTRIGLKINFSCPNVGLNPSKLIGEVSQAMDICRQLNIPIVPKFNALLPFEIGVEISKDPACSGLCVSNTIPWNSTNRINWQRLFGVNDSPLAKYGGGGLGGAPLLPLVLDWIRSARRHGLTKPIIGGGGILSKKDAKAMVLTGASGISLGSISLLRPWRIAGIIRYVNKLYRRLENENKDCSAL